MNRLALLAAFVLAAAPVSAQDSTKKEPVKMAGNWDFAFTSPQGDSNWRVKFEQSADTLWGTANTEFGAVNIGAVLVSVGAGLVGGEGGGGVRSVGQ